MRTTGKVQTNSEGVNRHAKCKHLGWYEQIRRVYIQLRGFTEKGCVDKRKGADNSGECKQMW